MTTTNPEYKPQPLTARVLQGLLLVNVAMSLIEGLWIAFKLQSAPAESESSEALLNAVLAVAVGFGTVFSMLACIVAYSIWVYRANQNARTFGTLMTFSPASCIWWFAVPFMNLVRPYQALKEIYQWSHQGAGNSQLSPSPWQFPVWWGSWLISGFLSQVSLRITLQGSGEFDEAAAGIDLLTMPVHIVSALALIWIVGAIQKLQQERKIDKIADVFA